MIRVVHLTPQLSRGGAGRAMLALAAHADPHRFEHAIVTLRPAEEGAARLAAAAGIRVLHPGPGALAEAIAGADLVHVHFWNHPALYDALATTWPEARVIAWCHVGGDEPPQVLPRAVVDFADLLLASNPHTAELPVLAGAMASGRAGMVLASPDFSRLGPRRAERREGRFTLAHVGTVDFAKMHPDFVALHAGLAIDEYRVVVGGDGAALPTLRRQIAEAGLDATFELRGYVEDVGALFAEADVFAYPIRPGYASELVLQEAMHAGLAPVVWARGGPSRMVIDGETGLVARDAASYREALERLASDEALRRRLGEAAAAHARGHWGAERSASRMVEWYSRLLESPKRRRDPLSPACGARLASGRTDGSAPGDSGAGRFTLSLGATMSPLRIRCEGTAHPRATLLAADRFVAAAAPTLAGPASGGVLHYRLEHPGDPLLHHWSSLVLAASGRPALAAAEAAAARRAGFEASPAATQDGGFPLAAEAATPSTAPLPSAAWVVPRGRLATIAARLRQGPATVAVLGTSVSAQREGYVPALARWIDEWTGHAHVHVRAAFGGVASFGCAFLMEKAFASKRPDVCFVECSTGDLASTVEPSLVGPAVEGIVRRLLGAGVAVIFVHLWRDRGDGRDQVEGSPVLGIHERIADRYDVPSIHVSRAIDREMEAGLLDRDRLFRDRVHTRDEGAFTIARFVGAALDEAASAADSNAASSGAPMRAFAAACDTAGDGGTDAGSDLPPPLHDDHFAAATILAVEESAATRVAARGTFRFLHPWIEVPAGASLRAPRVDGDLLGLLLVVGPHGGELRTFAAVGRRDYDTRDEWTHYERLHTLPFAGPLPLDAEVRVEVLSGTLRIGGWLVRPWPGREEPASSTRPPRTHGCDDDLPGKEKR